MACGSQCDSCHEMAASSRQSICRAYFQTLAAGPGERFHGAQEGAGINVIKIVAVAEVFLLQPREGAVFIHIIEEIEHCRRQGNYLRLFAKPGDRLLVADIEGDGQLRVNALEQADGDRIRHGIVELAIDDRLH